MLTILFFPIFFSEKLSILSSIKFINIILINSNVYLIVKYIFVVSAFFSNIIIFSYFLSFIVNKNSKKTLNKVPPNFSLLVGINKHGDYIYIPEKSLYQNILVTGSIGSRKNGFSNVSIYTTIN